MSLVEACFFAFHLQERQHFYVVRNLLVGIAAASSFVVDVEPAVDPAEASVVVVVVVAEASAGGYAVAVFVVVDNEESRLGVVHFVDLCNEKRVKFKM